MGGFWATDVAPWELIAGEGDGDRALQPVPREGGSPGDPDELQPGGLEEREGRLRAGALGTPWPPWALFPHLESGDCDRAPPWGCAAE